MIKKKVLVNRIKRVLDFVKECREAILKAPTSPQTKIGLIQFLDKIIEILEGKR